MDRPREWAATCFFLGEFPVASGTAGSLGAVALYLVASLALDGVALSLFAGLAGVALAAVGIAIGRWAQEFYRERDPREFVLDEAAGMLLALVAASPTVWEAERWQVALAAFLFFRLLDIVKLFPAGRSERFRGGWGIVVDDVVSGLYAAVCVHLWFHYV
ncbi:MAG: phosphatidylglycerophosphatase A [Candidatus Brocadiia bacterium]